MRGKGISLCTCRQHEAVSRCSPKHAEPWSRCCVMAQAASTSLPSQDMKAGRC